MIDLSPLERAYFILGMLSLCGLVYIIMLHPILVQWWKNRRNKKDD